MEEFSSSHGRPSFGPVVIVIAAYKEAANIGRVLDSMPKQIGDLATSVVVVVDGEDDGTSRIVREAGHYAVVAPVNRGQGAALRLGYRAAKEFGGSYVVTADADGQTDPADLEAALGPVVAGEKDFVNGSRRLGSSHGTDLVRNVGVVVYASLLSALTGQRVTDTANPIRAFRTDLLARLTLEEPQFQASELLISAISSGVRYGEVPVTMLNRSEGKSKKGGNLSYGYRYGRVLLRTYWRDVLSRRIRRPAPDGAPAVG
jgi:glycosyltransferase involved in cell wall biosynthesis